MGQKVNFGKLMASRQAYANVFHLGIQLRVTVVEERWRETNSRKEVSRSIGAFCLERRGEKNQVVNSH